MSVQSRERPFWQARYYDFNVNREEKRVEKLRYMHRNPVKRGLVEKPEDWPWSSVRYYATGVIGTVEIESFWTRARRDRQPNLVGRLRCGPPAAAAATTTTADYASSRRMTMADENYKKISFELEQDENGYPPDRWETLWANETEPGLYSVDNIPFYVKGISSGDVVSAESDGEQLIFKKLVRPSPNSVIRLYVPDAADVQAARDSFRALGVESELSNLPKLVAVEIPGNVSFGPVGNLLAEGQEKGRWQYEEGVLRHQLTA